MKLGAISSVIYKKFTFLNIYKLFGVKMKKLFISVLAILTFVSTTAFSQVTFSVNPGMELNGANVGYQFGNFVPYVGLQVFNGSAGLTDSYREYDYETGKIVSVKNETEISGTIFMPYVGLKYMFNKQGDIRPFLNGTFFLPFISGSAERNGVSDSDVEDALDNFSAWGAELGFGTEYKFSKNFSVSGEFGIRMLFANESTEYDDEIYNPNTDEYEMDTRKSEIDFNLNFTYSRIGLNFYF